MRNSLTKKQIHGAGTLQLAYRFNDLMHMGETMPAGDITMADARETVWIEDELRVRLIKLIGHDFYPPDHISQEAKK